MGLVLVSETDRAIVSQHQHQSETNRAIVTVSQHQYLPHGINTPNTIKKTYGCTLQLCIGFTVQLDST
jgi:hypothetical protein